MKSKSAINPQELLTNYYSESEKHYLKCLKKWKHSSSENLDSFLEILQSCSKKIVSLPDSGNMLAQVWEVMEIFFNDVEQWNSKSSPLQETTTIDTILNNWPQEFSAFSETLQKSIKLPINETYWEFQPGDTMRIKQWKTTRRLRNRLTKSYRIVLNPIRNLLRKSPLSKKVDTRQFSVKNFTQVFLELPYEDFLLQEWQNFLHEVLQQFSELYRVIKELSVRFIFYEEAETIWHQADPAKLAEHHQALAENISQLKELTEKLEILQKEALTRFQNWFLETSNEFIYNWNFASTPILPEKDFDERKIQERQQFFQKKFGRVKNAWLLHFGGERQDWHHDILLTLFQIKLGRAYFDVLQKIKEKISNQISPAFSESIGTLSDALKNINNLKKASPGELRRAISSEKTRLLKSLHQKSLPLIMDTLLKAHLSGDVQQFLDQVKEQVSALPQNCTIFRHRDRVNIPPKSEFVEIPVQELVASSVLSNFEKSVKESHTEVRGELNELMQGISEIDQVVEFNIDAALTVLQEKKSPKESLETVAEGLGRAKSKIENFVSQCDTLPQQIQNMLFNPTLKFITATQELLDSEKAIALKIQLAQAKAKERLREYRHRFWVIIRSALPKFWSLISRTSAWPYKQFMRMRKIIGLTPADYGVEESLIHFISEISRNIKSLPYVYQRLFHITPLTDERFLAGRDEELSVLKEDFMNWGNGQYMTTAIMGERGSGRTTLLNFAKERIYSHMEIRDISLYETIDTPEKIYDHIKKTFPESGAANLIEFETWLNELEEPIVCILENIQNLFLKKVNGFNTLEQFLLLMSRTHRKVFWIITSTRYSWEYLHKVINISQYFQRVLTLGGLDQEVTESIILKRHRVTGYQLFFESPEWVGKSRKFKRLATLEEQQKFLREMFFEQLQKFGSGNITVTMLFWLRAIQKIEKNRLILTPEINFDFSFLYRLMDTEFFTLGAILQHEILSAEDHAEIFHQDVDQSILLLNNLCNKGLLHEVTGGYAIHPFLYRPVVNVLKGKNIIH
jgi:hypothetical protein